MTSTTLPAQARTGILTPVLPYFVAAGIYLVVLMVGSNLLNDGDTYWHIAVGRWILANGFPHTDPFSFTDAGRPWIAKEWLSQIAFFEAYRFAGWNGVVVLAAGSVALAFGLLARFLQERLAPLPVIALVALAFMLVAPHAVARPHVLALPVMVAWVGGLVRAVDRGKTPPHWLLPLMVLWANLHGGFTFGIFLAAAISLDAVVSADKAQRAQKTTVWIGFCLLALVAGCITPYGPQSLLVTVKVLGLGPALSIIGEWKPASFAHLAGLELALLVGAGFTLWRGFTLPPVRVLILLGLLHMALSAERNGEIFGLLVPLFLMAPLPGQVPPVRAEKRATLGGASAWVATAITALMIPATAGLVAANQYRPNSAVSPVAAVAALKSANSGPVFNDYDFGGYMIFAGVPTFIDGRTELYGGDFTMRHYRAVTLTDLADFEAMLDQYKIGATLLAPATPAAAFLDTQPDWKRLYADDTAVAHVRLSLRPTLR